jgi:hypothetical protein
MNLNIVTIVILIQSLFIPIVWGMDDNVATKVQDSLFKKHALPAGPKRTKLDTIFAHERNPNLMTNDSSFASCKSWHWLVGTLKDSLNQTFVVKAAKHPSNTPLKAENQQGKNFIHAPRQNLSRIEKADQARAVINQYNLQHWEIPQSWVYPLSADDEDLNSPNLTDHDVIIVEEFVDGSIEGLFTLTTEEYKELEILARESQLTDLHIKNLKRDRLTSKLKPIDLEDTLAAKKYSIEKSENLISRPLNQFKVRCEEQALSLIKAGITGLANTESEEVMYRGGTLLAKGAFIYGIKRNSFEIATVTTILAGIVTGFIGRHSYLLQKNKALIRECRIQIKNQIKKMLIISSYELNEQICLTIAREIVPQKYPGEEREDIFKAFATIALAEINAHHLNDEIVYEIIDKEVAFIKSTWYTDWSISARTQRAFKTFSSNVLAVLQKAASSVLYSKTSNV